MWNRPILIDFFKSMSARESVLRFRRHFFTGLLVILPSIITIWIITLILRLFGTPFGSLLNSTIFGNGLGPWSELFLGFLLAISLITIIGYFVRLAFIRSLTKKIEDTIEAIPFINMIYSTIKTLIETVTKDTSSFKHVALIEYPRKGIYTLGFITRDSFPELRIKGKDPLPKQMVSVFVPTTPNPTSGFFLLIPKSDVKILNIPIEEGLKLIVSAGVVQPKENLAEKDESPTENTEKPV